MRHHAIKCWGEEAIQNVSIGAKEISPDGSIFAAFARQGQKPVHISHRSHTSLEARFVQSLSHITRWLILFVCRAHIVKWVTESNRPANIINDRELKELLTAGQPKLEIPSASTVARDIKLSFERCKGRIAKLLREYPSHLNFATDAWTSPNHRVIVAWTVHLEHQGHMLGFLLDIVEVPEASSVILLNDLTLISF